MIKDIFRRLFFPQQSFMSRAALAVWMFSGYLGLTVLGMWLAKVWAFDRPVFNLDYLLVGLVFLWISRTFSAFLLVAFCMIECARYLIPTYFFSKQSFSVLFWMRLASNWSPLVRLIIGVVITAVFLLSVMVFRRYKLSPRIKLEATAWIFGLGVLLVAADVLNGTNSLIHLNRDTSFFPNNIAGSALQLVTRETLHAMRGSPARFTPIQTTASATGRYFSESLASPETNCGLEKLFAPLSADNPGVLPDKIVLIIFESLTVLDSDTELKNWREPFKRLENRYTIESGMFSWSGATLRGEVRELCWQSLDGYQIKSFPTTLSLILKRLNYRTSAFHGFYKTMYERDRLYPLFGFDHMVFLDEMRKGTNDVPLAGTLFHGAEDSYVATLVRREISKPGKQFVYWLTLSSHVPINVPFAKKVASEEKSTTDPHLPPAIWGYTVICHETLDSIARIAADESLTNCDFIIVGDHPLPLSSAQLKSYIVPGQVPYLILRHRNPASKSLIQNT